jgi:DNA repair exonuclease SbcCD nuclease subunit
MKIIHCSDLHLDSKMESNLDKEKARQRKNEILYSFQNMVNFAEENDVKIIIIAGDLFDKNKISVKAKNIVKDTIKLHEKIDFLYLKGNHDEDCFLEEENLKNLKLFDKKIWKNYRYGDIVISGIEFGEKSNYEIYKSLMLNQNDFNIVVLHGQESNYYNKKNKAEIINIQELKNKNIDYLALGHIHKYKKEKLDNRGIYCYSGCLEGRGFDECGDKGFVLLDIQENKIQTKFIKNSIRNLEEIEVDISGTLTTTDVEKRIDEKIQNINNENLIKIVLTGKIKINSERDIEYLINKYNKIFYFIKIYDKTSLDINYMEYENDISLKGEFIRMVLNEDLPDEEKKDIITAGIKSLSGEEEII